MKKIWSGIQLLVIITVMSGCGMKGKETSETNEAQKSTVQSAERSIKLDVPEVIETTETGRFSVTGKTEPKTNVDISYGVNEDVIKSDENGNFKYDGYSLSDEDNSYSVYVSVNTDTETELKKEITVTRSKESIKKIADEKAKEGQKSREKEDKSELKQQFLGLLQDTLGTTLKVTLVEELTVYSLAPKEGDDQLVSEIAWIMAGKDSSSWFDLRDTLVSLSIEFSEKIGEPVTFYLSHDGTMEGNVLRISDGTILFDGVEERLIERGYK